jgi:hypothetical protein
MIRHDSLRRRAYAFASAKVCRALLICAIATAALLLALAAPSSRAQTQTQYIYVVSNGLSTYSVDATTGVVSLVNAAPTSSAPPVAGPMVINSSATYLFSIGLNSASQGAVFVYSIAPSGAIQQTAPSPYSISQPTGTPFALALSQNGQYLYVVSSYLATQTNPQYGQTSEYSETFVDLFSIGADGTLTLANTILLPDPDYCNGDVNASTTPFALDLHPAQKWIYIFESAQQAGGSLCTGEPSVVQQLLINADGTLSAGQLYQVNLYTTPASGFASSPDGTQLFTLGGLNLTPKVDALAINPVTGQVSAAGGYTGTGGYNGGLSADWSSTYLYNSTLGTFSVTDGNLQLLSNPPPQAPSNLATSSLVPFLFGLGSGSISVYQPQSDGSLTQVSGSPFTVAQGTQLLSGTPALVDTAVMWLAPDTPITISNIVVGQTGTGEFSILNQGYGPLTISSVSLTGDPSFTQTNTCSSPLNPGQSCTVTITYAPTANDDANGTVTIVSSAGTRTLGVTGNGVNPAPYPALQSLAQGLFPDTALGSSSVITFQLSNPAPNATAPLTVGAFSIMGSNPGDFSQTNNCPGTLAVNASCSITVTFTPQALGSRVATLVIQTNGPPPGNSVQASMTGNGFTTVTKYTFSTSVSGPGTITQSPTGTSFANNTTITLTATPNANSSFISWSGPCANTFQSTCTFVLNANTSVTATFATNVTFNLVVVGLGTVSQQPTGTSFAPGTTLTIYAYPNSGQQFVSFTPAGVCSPNTVATTCYATLNANTTLTATFTSPSQYTLVTTVFPPAYGSITQSPVGTSFAPNTSITLTAVPAAGNGFEQWLSGPCNGSTNLVCSFNISSNVSATAEFAPAYTLSVGVEGPGTVTQSPMGTTFVSGTQITVTATPNAGATFTGWNAGACGGSKNPVCVFNLSQDSSVIATFAAPQYTLTTTATGPGTTTQSPTGTSFASGTAITLTAVPNSGATFTSWSGGACAGSTSTTCTFNITANTSVTATFAGGPAVTVPNPSQSGSAGSAFTFALSTSGFSTPPTLKASCAIPEGTCTISGTTLTVTTTAAPARATHDAAVSIAAWPGDSTHDGPSSGVGASTSALRTIRAMLIAMLTWLFAAFAMRLGAASSHRARLALGPLAMLAMVAGLALLAACGGGGGGGGQTGTPAGTYTVTVTATAGTQTATTNVSVTVQ